MFLAKALLSGASGSGHGGSLARGLGGLLTGGGGHGGNIGGLVGGLVSLISEAAAQYNPEPPPPPRNHFTNVEAYESEEIRQFRRLFAQLAGDDMEVCATELRHILNKVVSRHQDLKTDGFSLDTCRSMVAVMDCDTNGKLGFEEFKYLWNNIKKWQCVYKQYDTDQSGTVGRAQLPNALKAAGFHLKAELLQVIVRRYADEDGSMDFNDFISCLVRLDSMFRTFKSLDRDGSGQIKNGDGTIDFREYVIGLSILCNPANTEETIQMAFKLFDMDDDGTITEKEFASIIQSALGVPELDVSMLFKEIDADETGKLSYDEFKNFAFKHPEYASLFTTYLDLQRHQVDLSDEQYTESLKGKHSPVKSTTLVSEITPVARNKVCPEGNEEDSSSTSDKKED
ncbi:Calpain small subunit 2 [Pitangus sulphuratus]|nr:Calpain small subunit 2 [Pitangus sulphuratus]